MNGLTGTHRQGPGGAEQRGRNEFFVIEPDVFHHVSSVGKLETADHRDGPIRLDG